jgi:acyl carrier protein
MINIFSKRKQEEKNCSEFELLSNLIKGILPEEKRTIELTLKTRFTDLGFDSIQFINLLLSLEDIINKDLEEIVAQIDIASIETIEDVVKVLKTLKEK